MVSIMSINSCLSLKLFEIILLRIEKLTSKLADFERDMPELTPVDDERKKLTM